MSGAEIAERIEATNRKLDALGKAFLHLARYLIQREATMSAITDAIKADLAALDADVDRAVANASDTAKNAIATEEGELSEIRASIEAIGGKVHGMVSTVAAAVTPAAAPAQAESSAQDASASS